MGATGPFRGGDVRTRIVAVEFVDGTLAQADTYLVRPESKHRLEPVEWDFELFLAQGKTGFVIDYAVYESVRAPSA